MLGNWDSKKLDSVMKIPGVGTELEFLGTTWCDVDTECKRRCRQPSKYGGDRADTPKGVGGRETQGQGQGSHAHRPRG